MSYGVVTEQGDLGLGFDEIPQDEAAKIQQQEEENERQCQDPKRNSGN